MTVPQENLSGHCDLLEQGEPRDSELSQHASLISWQKKSIAVVAAQLAAELPVLEKERYHLA